MSLEPLQHAAVSFAQPPSRITGAVSEQTAAAKAKKAQMQADRDLERGPAVALDAAT